MPFQIIISVINGNPSTVKRNTQKQVDAYVANWTMMHINDHMLSVHRINDSEIATNEPLISKASKSKSTLVSQHVAKRGDNDQYILSVYKEEAIDIPNFVAYTDDGHGWMGVKRALLTELGILELVTRYSYQKGGMVYLEEDADVSLFFKTMKIKGREFDHTCKHTNGRHPIRSYDSFTLTADETIIGLSDESQQKISWNEEALTLFLDGKYTDLVNAIAA